MSFCIPFHTYRAAPSAKWIVSEETSFFQLQAHTVSFMTWPFKTPAIQEMKRLRFEEGEHNTEPYRILVKKAPTYTCIAAGDDWERISLTWRYVAGTLNEKVEKAILKGQELIPFVVNEVVTRFIHAALSPQGGPAAVPPRKIEGTLTRLRDVQSSDSNVLLVLKAELDRAVDPDYETAIVLAAVQQRLLELKMASLAQASTQDLDLEINRLEIKTQETERFLLPYVKQFYATRRAKHQAETTDPSGKQMFAFSSEILGWVGSCQDKELLESFLEAVKGRIATLERLQEAAKEKEEAEQEAKAAAIKSADITHGDERHEFCPVSTLERILVESLDQAKTAADANSVSKKKAEEEAAAAAKKAEEEEAAKKAEEEAAAAKKAEEEAAAAKKAEEEAAAAKKAEEEAAAAKKAEEEASAAAAAKKAEEEAAATKKAEEEAAATKKAEEEAAAAKKKAEEEEAAKKAEEEAAAAKKAEEEKGEADDDDDDEAFEDAPTE